MGDLMTPYDMRLGRLEHDNANLEAEIKKLRADINPELQVKATEKIIHLAMILRTILRRLGDTVDKNDLALDKIIGSKPTPDGF